MPKPLLFHSYISYKQSVACLPAAAVNLCVCVCVCVCVRVCVCVCVSVLEKALAASVKVHTFII
jgi:hypothetical protein